MTKTETVKQKVREFIAEMSVTSRTEAPDDLTLTENCGFDELDRVEVLMRIEFEAEELTPECSFEDNSDAEQKWVTVGDVMNYIDTLNIDNR